MIGLQSKATNVVAVVAQVLDAVAPHDVEIGVVNARAAAVFGCTNCGKDDTKYTLHIEDLLRLCGCRTPTATGAKLRLVSLPEKPKIAHGGQAKIAHGERAHIDSIYNTPIAFEQSKPKARN